MKKKAMGKIEKLLGTPSIGQRDEGGDDMYKGFGILIGV